MPESDDLFIARIRAHLGRVSSNTMPEGFEGGTMDNAFRQRRRFVTFAGLAGTAAVAAAVATLGLALHVGRAPTGTHVPAPAGNTATTPATTPTPTPETPSAATPSASPVPPDPTAGWPIHTDAALKYSIRYPSGWYDQSSTLPGTQMSGSHFSSINAPRDVAGDGAVVEISPSASAGSCPPAGQDPQFRVTAQQPIAVDGVPATEKLGADTPGPPAADATIYVTHSGRCYSFFLFTATDQARATNLPIFNAMIASFRFGPTR